jgi:hypothetical protein
MLAAADFANFLVHKLARLGGWRFARALGPLGLLHCFSLWHDRLQLMMHRPANGFASSRSLKKLTSNHGKWSRRREALTEVLNGSRATKAVRSLIERIVLRSGLARGTFSFSSIAGTFIAERQASRRGIGALLHRT